MDSLPREILQQILSYCKQEERMKWKYVCKNWCTCIRNMTSAETHLPLAHVVPQTGYERKIIIKYDSIYQQFQHLTSIHATGLDVSIKLLIHYMDTLTRVSVGSLIVHSTKEWDMRFPHMQSVSISKFREKDFPVISLFPNITEFNEIGDDCDPLDAAFKRLPANLTSLSCLVASLRELISAPFAPSLEYLTINCTESISETTITQFKLLKLQSITISCPCPERTSSFIRMLVLCNHVPLLKSLRVCCDAYSDDRINSQIDFGEWACKLPALETYHIALPDAHSDQQILSIPADMYLTLHTLIMDRGILSDSSLESLAEGHKLPNLKNLQLTDPDNDFTCEAVIRFLRATFAQRLSVIHIQSFNEISASYLQDTLAILFERRVSGELKEADIVFDCMRSQTLARLVEANPSGFRVYSGRTDHRITKMKKNPLIQTLKYSGSQITTTELIQILESAPGMVVHPSLVRFVKREGIDGDFMSSLPHHPEIVTEIVRQGRMTDTEAGTFQNLVQEYGIYRTHFSRSVIISLLWIIVLLIASPLCVFMMPFLVHYILDRASADGMAVGFKMTAFTPAIWMLSGVIIFPISCFVAIRVAKVLFNSRMSDSKFLALILWTSWHVFLAACGSAVLYSHS